MKNRCSKLLEKKRRESIKGRSVKDIGHQIFPRHWKSENAARLIRDSSRPLGKIVF